MPNHCKFCGTTHTATTYPKSCGTCGTVEYINPTPVAVMLLPVYDATGRTGLLVGKRAIDPSMGLYGLPGGFVDVQDRSFEDAARRELLEETGIALTDKEVGSKLTHSMCDGRNILVFVQSRMAVALDWVTSNFQPSDECPAIDVIWEPKDLAFPSHTEAARRFFESLNGLWV